MEPTQWPQPGDALPALAGSLPFQKARQRASTLLAVGPPGSRGEVRVWTPDRRRQWLTLGGNSLLIVLVLAWALRRHDFGFLIFEIILIGTFLNAVGDLRSPGYIVTDDGGLSLTSFSGSRSVLWHNLRSFDVQSESLVFHAPERMVATLRCYSPESKEELLSLAIARAGLVPYPGSPGEFVRPSMLQAPSPEPPFVIPEVLNAGLSFERSESGKLRIEAVEDYSPAYDQGLMPGDVIQEINGVLAARLDEGSARAQTEGPVGSIIRLKVQRKLWHGKLEMNLRLRPWKLLP